MMMFAFAVIFLPLFVGEHLDIKLTLFFVNLATSGSKIVQDFYTSASERHGERIPFGIKTRTCVNLRVMCAGRMAIVTLLAALVAGR